MGETLRGRLTQPGQVADTPRGEARYQPTSAMVCDRQELGRKSAVAVAPLPSHLVARLDICDSINVFRAGEPVLCQEAAWWERTWCRPENCILRSRCREITTHTLVDGGDAQVQVVDGTEGMMEPRPAFTPRVRCTRTRCTAGLKSAYGPAHRRSPVGAGGEAPQPPLSG